MGSSTTYMCVTLLKRLSVGETVRKSAFTASTLSQCPLESMLFSVLKRFWSRSNANNLQRRSQRLPVSANRSPGSYLALITHDST